MSDLTDFLLTSLSGSKNSGQPESDRRPAQHEGRDEQPISVLKLSASVEKALLTAGLTTIQALVKLSGADLLVLPGVDIVTAAEVKRKLKAYQSHRQVSPREFTPQPASQGSKCYPVDIPQRDTKQVPSGVSSERPLTILDLPTGYTRALERAGIRSVEALCSTTLEDLVTKFGFGSAASRTIQRVVESRGLRLGVNPVPAKEVVPGVTSSSQISRQNSSHSEHQDRQSQGPGKWLEIAFASLSRAERCVLVARYGLDGNGIRGFAMAAAEAGILTNQVTKTEMLAIARLRHSLPRTRLAPLASLYSAVIQEHGRPCSVSELARAVGYPAVSDGYDPVAFTRFILPWCPGLHPEGADRWDRETRTAVQGNQPVSLPKKEQRTSPPAVTEPSPEVEMATVELSRIQRVEARLVALVAVLGAEANYALDVRRLKDFADGAGIRLTMITSIDIELGAYGIWLGSPMSGELRLTSSLRLVVARRDLPGKLADLDFLRGILPKVGVFKKVGAGTVFPPVQLLSGGD